MINQVRHNATYKRPSTRDHTLYATGKVIGLVCMILGALLPNLYSLSHSRSDTQVLLDYLSIAALAVVPFVINAFTLLFPMPKVSEHTPNNIHVSDANVHCVAAAGGRRVRRACSAAEQGLLPRCHRVGARIQHGRIHCTA